MKGKIKKIMNEKTAIHITSMEQLKELNKIASELGILPLSTNYRSYINRGDFCVTFNPHRMLWCQREWYISDGFKVIEFDDLRKNECIVIYRKDNEVIALDKSTGKKAIAKCAPEDTFDFMTGAKLAFERLTKNVTFRMLCVEDYKEYVRKGKIYEFVNGKTVFNTGMESCRYNSFEEFKENNVIMGKHCVELKDGDDPEEVLNKYDSEIKVGDRVKVVNRGMSYTLYVDWVEKHVRNGRDLRYKFDYANRPDTAHLYTVKRIAKHLTGDVTLVYIIDYETNRCYVIDVEGLKKC